jgi:hypothetical protein
MSRTISPDSYADFSLRQSTARTADSSADCGWRGRRDGPVPGEVPPFHVDDAEDVEFSGSGGATSTASLPSTWVCASGTNPFPDFRALASCQGIGTGNTALISNTSTAE